MQKVNKHKSYRNQMTMRNAGALVQETYQKPKVERQAKCTLKTDNRPQRGEQTKRGRNGY